MRGTPVGSLSLLCGRLLPPALERIGGVLCVQNVVPPAEAAGIVANELLVVEVVVIRTGPERQEVVKTPGEFIATVRVDGLEQTQDNPDVHGENVQVTGEGAPDDWAADGSETEDHDLDRGGIFGSQTEGRRILVVNLVNSLVERTPMQGTVGEVVPGIFHHKKDRDLVSHSPEGGERNRSRETEELSHWVEEPVGRGKGR